MVYLNKEYTNIKITKFKLKKKINKITYFSNNRYLLKIKKISYYIYHANKKQKQKKKKNNRIIKS